MSTTTKLTDDDYSTESAMQRHATILHAKLQCTRADKAVQQAHVTLQARLVDFQMAQQDDNKQLSIQTQQELQKAQEEVEKKEGFKKVLVDTLSQLQESHAIVTTQREVSRFGPLGRIPSSSLFVKEEVIQENPWLNADMGRYFCGIPFFSQKRVAQFYVKYHWERVFGSRGKIQCMVTGQWSCCRQNVTVGRILPKSTSQRVLHSLGLTKSDLNHVRNMLVLATNIQKYFNVQRLSFVLHEDGMPQDVGLCFRLVVWDKTILDKELYKGSQMTIRDVENHVFRFYSDERIPFLRALSLHAQQSFERAIQKRYLDASAQERPAEFGSPLVCESITCSSDDDEIDVDDDLSCDSTLSLESVRSIATEQILEPLDYQVSE